MVVRKMMKEDKMMKELPLHDAVKRNDFVKVRQLIKSGYDLNTEDQFERTAIGYACGYFQREEVIRVLLENGADPNSWGGPKKYDCYDSCLHRVARSHSPNLELIKLMTERGANPNLTAEPFGYTVLEEARRFYSLFREREMDSVLPEARRVIKYLEELTDKNYVKKPNVLYVVVMLNTKEQKEKYFKLINELFHQVSTMYLNVTDTFSAVFTYLDEKELHELIEAFVGDETFFLVTRSSPSDIRSDALKLNDTVSQGWINGNIKEKLINDENNKIK